MRTSRPVSRSVALSASAASILFVALVAATPGSPFQPILPTDAQPSGPLRFLAGIVGLDGLGAGALATVGIVAVAFAAISFLLVLRAAWRGEISVRTVIGFAVAYHVVVLFLPLLFSRDVYSYAYYGKIAATYHANPYVLTPADFPRDALAAFASRQWVGTPAVYGPLFTLASSLVARVVDSVAGFIVAFRLMAVAASLGTIAIVARLVGRERPDRTAFAVALIGLNPVVLFQSVASGQNDVLVMLSIAAALALVFAGHDLPATAVLALGTLVKATAAVPLVLLIVVAVARRPKGERGRALLGHLAVAGGIGLAFALPFLQREDPSLGMIELAKHEGWLAPSRFFRRLLVGISGDALGVIARIAFPVLLLAAVYLVAGALVRRGGTVTPFALGAGWGWALLFLMLLGPVLLPWYVTWVLPLAWLLPSVPRAVIIGVGTALTVSQFTAELGARVHSAYENLFLGHPFSEPLLNEESPLYVLTPVVIGLLVWLAIDLVRRVRSGAPLEDEPRHVAAAAREH